MDKLKKIFAAVLEIPESAVMPELAQETTPEWDSLRSIVLLTEIENGFGLKFNFDEAMAVRTVADAAALLASKGVTL